jgi:hypothetical protein
MVPFAPTVTNCDPAQATPFSSFKVPEVLGVHVMPSGEVMMVPLSPTATNVDSVEDHATPRRVLPIPEGRGVQVNPAVDAVTTRPVDPDIVPDVAVILAAPAETPAANPPLSTVAFILSDVVHTTWLVISCVVLSAKVPVALNCTVLPLTMAGILGVTVREIRDPAAKGTVAVKLSPVESEPLIVTVLAEGVNVKPAEAGVTVYDPFERPPKM